MHELIRKALFPPRAVAAAAWIVASSSAALAQAVPDADAAAAPALRSSPQLQETIKPELRKQLPTFVRGDQVSGQTDLQTTVEGNAELRRGDTVIKADRLEYYQPDDQARARGNVHINRTGNTYDGTLLELKVDAFEGFFNDVDYFFILNGAHGKARRIDFIDSARAVVSDSTYTTCVRGGPDWVPDWIMRAATIRVDQEEETGTAENAMLRFKGVPVLPVPSISFPLSDKRKSGLLPPTIGISSQNGFEVIQPYYWNIAPNRDATFWSTAMSKRGLGIGAEFRYLEALYKGQIRADYMPDDALRERDRWGYSWQHQGALTDIPLLGTVGVGVNLNRVSDDNYWRDFPRGTRSLTQRLLPNDVNLTWSAGDLALQLRALKYQTLQLTESVIVPPYDRMPQLHATYTKLALPGGFDAVVEADYTRFEADKTLTLQPNAQRSYVQAQLSRPFVRPGWFVTPKVIFNSTHYDFDGSLSTGAMSADRNVPSFSLDSGLIFERDASYFGRAFRQTLEPRAFYTYTPYRDQSALPVYDTALNDFNFATVYTENAFGGYDRISDNNLLTLGVTTRLFDADTGAEAARFGIAQRLRFEEQKVTLPGGSPVSKGLSSILLGAGINWTPRWGFDSTVQYNTDTGRSERSTISARYNPSNYRTVSAAYRYQRDSSEQIDLGWQWPINDLWGDRGRDLGPGRGQGGDRWYSVGRLNYSMRDKRMVDTVIGIEYDACCWIGRVVLENLRSTTTTSNTRLLFQLEFVGFSRLSLGSDPLQTFKQNVPSYQNLRQQTTTPSRFGNYD
ncbi:LPS-assembly protein LptD [Xylophilus sp.]|uniref:LPS-assembly protein LptD n=1 Tax=Xylophilus sp. TaxID=2653893 RepID=UPI0013BDEA72|nr:LPS-assembly protein LptD [Xylophilus sp.]KAF1044084.1 MAG: LPS-assembly protein LptD [Xylophilus sp.]